MWLWFNLTGLQRVRVRRSISNSSSEISLYFEGETHAERLRSWLLEPVRSCLGYLQLPK